MLWLPLYGELAHPGLVVNKIIPIAETAIILKATQTPDPSKNNNKEIKKIVKNISFISI